jgi:hypothetical protein
VDPIPPGRSIEPLQAEDLAELSRFLTAGFAAPADAEFARPEVLQWKYLDPTIASDGPSGLVARREGTIAGFVGHRRGSFSTAGVEATTLHMMDWLTSRGSNVGAYLFLRAHRSVATAYVLGGSPDARRVIVGGGYEKRGEIPVFRRVLRPWHRIRAEGIQPRTIVKTLVDATSLLKRPRRPRLEVELSRVDAFGPEVAAILEERPSDVIVSTRSAGRLNHLLRYPGGGISGWRIVRDGRDVGFGVLSVVGAGLVRVGKLVECFLGSRDPELWHAALEALTAELSHQRADFALACTGAPWMTAGLLRAGYRERYRLDFHLRDKEALLPRDRPFHLTFFEADYAHLP